MKTFVSDDHKYHYYLWRWLARNPTKNKSDWPGFKKLNEPRCHCFACSKAESSNTINLCLCCPIVKWRTTGCPAECRFDLYGVWRETRSPEIALQISELKWEEI